MIVNIDVLTTLKRGQEENKKEFLWFDPVDKILHKFNCGAIEYKYVPFELNGEPLQVFVQNMGWINGKTIASAKPIKTLKYQDNSNFPQIKQWFEDNQDELNLEWLDSDNATVFIGFPNDKEGNDRWKSAIEESLYEKRFRYDFRS